MNELNDNTFDLGSEPVDEEFDPFAEDDDNETETMADNVVKTDTNIEQTTKTPETEKLETSASEQVKTPAETIGKKTDTKESEEVVLTDKPPVFEYAGATENIDDASKTFDELRIEKSSDFPELEDGKRVSWTVEYGKITKTVSDPKGTSIGKMKSDIETSKEFTDSLKKPKADKNPTCKVKPRVTAQSKGTAMAYKGVYTNMTDAENSGKVISILPAKDGKVYEIRKTEMGKFVTPITGSDMLSEVQAGFIPALPLIPMHLVNEIIGLFRHYICNDKEQEVLVNIYWDKQNREYVVDVPEQVVTKVSVKSRENPYFTNERFIHYMDIHSHNSMKAYFSTIDDNDEKATRLYTVIGRLDKLFPEVKSRISNGGKFQEINPSEVFALETFSFPDNWKGKVHPSVDENDGFRLPLGGESS